MNFYDFLLKIWPGCNQAKMDTLITAVQELKGITMNIIDKLAELQKDTQRALDALATVKEQNTALAATVEQLKAELAGNGAALQLLAQAETAVDAIDAAVEAAVPETPAAA